VVGQHPADHILLAGRQVDLSRGQLGMAKDELDVGERQGRVLGHPVGGRVAQGMQGHRGAGLLVDSLEHPVHGVVRQRKQDGTRVYETQVEIDGARAHIELPHGQRRIVRDQRIADWAGSFATFEAYSIHGLTDSRVGFTEIWAQSLRVQ